MKIKYLLGKLFVCLIVFSLIGCTVPIHKIKPFGPEPSPPNTPPKFVAESHTQAPVQSVQSDKNRTLTITGSSVNIRSGPGVTFEVIGTCKSGDIFEILEEVTDWIKIRIKQNTFGWVNAKLVKKMDK